MIVVTPFSSELSSSATSAISTFRSKVTSIKQESSLSTQFDGTDDMESIMGSAETTVEFNSRDEKEVMEVVTAEYLASPKPQTACEGNETVEEARCRSFSLDD